MSPSPTPSDEVERPQSGWRHLRIPLLGELGRLVRFGVVGGGLFALDLVIFLALVDGASLAVGWAQVISVTVRSIVGFFAHKWFTFRGDSAEGAAATAGQSLAYILQGVVNVPVSAGVVIACVWLLGGWELGGKLLAEVVMIAEVYLLYRFVVFGRGLVRR